MVPYMDNKSIHIQINTNMKDNLLTANKMVKEQGHMQMAGNMKERLCEMAKVN